MIKKITLLGTIVFFTLLFIYCTTDNSTILGPFGNSDKYLSVSSLSADKATVYSRGDSSIVRIKIFDIDNSPAIGLRVSFATLFGKITESDITDSNGVAIATFISDENTGVNTITVDTGIKKYTLTINVVNYQPIYSVPAYIVIESEIQTLLADGISKTNIIAKVYDTTNEVIPGAVFNFSTTIGSLNYTTDIRANQEGLAEVTLTSAGSSIDITAIVKAVVTADTSVSEDINIQLRGITSITYIDSFKMSDDGIYKAYIRTNLRETSNAENITTGAVLFSSPVGTMTSYLEQLNGQGMAFSELNAEVLPTTQNDIFITSKLSTTSEVSSESEAFDIPGVEILINTIGGEIMGDGEGYALVKATLRKSDGNIAIPLTGISWSTTLGTILERSITNTAGQTIDTLRIDNAVSIPTNATITASYGSNVSTSDVLTFIPPVNNQRLILGFETNIASDDSNFVACEMDDEFAVRDFGISAFFVDEYSRGMDWKLIYFSAVPNNFARICDRAYTKDNGIATVMLAYQPQYGGEIVRVWATYEDGTKGSIDIILPVVGNEDDTGGG
ncbi:Ig-like domain-containing protein [Candidatus Neomarinimicrobiota bacterium]